METSEIPQFHERALQSTGRFVAGVAADRWHASTPCEAWDVTTLVNHLVAGNLWAAELGRGLTIDEVGDRLDGDVLGDDPVAAYEASAKAAGAAFGAEGAMEAMFAVSYGPVPGKVYARHRLLDVFVHGWDLAVATGQETRLDPDLVEACLAYVEPRTEMRTAWGFAELEAPAGADTQARFLALVGRRS
jgi:uncharacterized protein (TIGR03086 family)